MALAAIRMSVGDNVLRSLAHDARTGIAGVGTPGWQQALPVLA